MDRCDVCEEVKSNGTTGICQLNDHVSFICNDCIKTTRTPCECCGETGRFLEHGVCDVCQE